MPHAVNSSEVSEPVAPMYRRGTADKYVCIGVKGVCLIARCNSRRKIYFAEYSQQSRSFQYSL